MLLKCLSLDENGWPGSMGIVSGYSFLILNRVSKNSESDPSPANIRFLFSLKRLHYDLSVEYLRQ